jgi:hypothetical protein
MPGPLQTIVGSFKSASTREINQVRTVPGASVWQRGYFDRVIRDEHELAALREYVLGNPGVWKADRSRSACVALPSTAPWL